MIKFENGLVNISGKGIDILSEYAAITHEIKEMFAKNGGEEKEIKEQLRHSFEYGLMSEEELGKRFIEAMKDPSLVGMLIGAAGLSLLFGQKDK